MVSKTQPMATRFVFHMLAVFCLICLAAGLKTAALSGLLDFEWAKGWIYALGSVGGLLWLARAAFVLRKRGGERFDMIVASESIIAFGIFSLVLGLVMSLNFASSTTLDLSDLTFEALRPLMVPFLEGLCAAAVAPALATVLRQYDALSAADEGELIGGSAVPGGSGFFKRLEILEERLNRAVAGAERLAASCEQGAERIEAAVESLADSTAGLGDSIAEQQARFAASATASEGELAGLSRSVAESRGALEALTGETRALKAAATEGTTLLNGLAKLIASIDRFIKPDDSDRSPESPAGRR